MTSLTRAKKGLQAVLVDAITNGRLPVFDPQGFFMSTWRPMMLLLVLWAVTAAPFDISFWWEPPKAYKYLGYAVDIIFLLDLVLQFRVAYVHGSCLEQDPWKIALHYARTWLMLDVVSNLPLDWFVSSTAKTRKVLKLVKLPKLIRFVKLLRLLKDQSYYIGLMSVIGLIALVSHYYACFWALSLVGDCDMGASIECPDVGEAYLESLSVAVSALSGNDAWMRFIGPEGASRLAQSRGPGEPLRPHEELVTTAMGILGFVLVACLFGSVSSTMASLNEVGRAVTTKRLYLRRQMELARVPRHLQVKVEATYEHMWQFGQFGNHDHMLRDPVLSLDLRRRLAMCAYGPSLQKVPMFANLLEEDLMRMAQKIEIHYYTPGDMIVRKGEKGDEMFFVTSGVAHAVGFDEKVLKVYHEGDFFGEIAFLNPGTARAVSVRCVEFCSTMVIHGQCMTDLHMEDVLQAINVEARLANIEYCRQTWKQRRSLTPTPDDSPKRLTVGSP